MSVPAQAVILAAGHGRRLRPFTDRLPKPLMPFLNVPLLHHALALLRRAGVRRVWINAFHRAEAVRAWLASRADRSLDVELVVEQELLGTAGGLANLWQRMARSPVLVLASDIVADFDLPAFVRAHRSAGALASMALTAAADPELYGPVQRDQDGLLSDIAGLTGRGGGPALVNASAHLLEPEFLDGLPRQPSCLVRQGYVPQMLAGARCAGWVHPGSWAETGTPAALLAAQQAAFAGRLTVAQELWALGGVRCLGAGAGACLVHPEAHVEPGVRLGGGTTVAARARVAAGARLERCLVLPGASVPAGAVLTDRLLDGVA